MNAKNRHLESRRVLLWQSLGFTLVEMIITIAILGLLAAIAIPAYKTYVIRSNRADAQSQLMQMAQAMERTYNANDTYNKASGGVMTTASLEGGAYTQSPATGTAVYQLSIPVSKTTYYQLKATAVSTGINKSDGYMTIDSLGNRSWDKNNNGTIQSTENTWQQ